MAGAGKDKAYSTAAPFPITQFATECLLGNGGGGSNIHMEHGWVWALAAAWALDLCLTRPNLSRPFLNTLPEHPMAQIQPK